MKLSDRIGRRMKLQDLHVLLTVVQAGSMGQAAERLNTSQPNVSRSIADLEHAVGVRLLDRYQQGVEPTEYGRALLESGMAAFDDLRQGVKRIEFLADPATGEVRIGSIIPLAASFVSAVIDRVSRRYPRLVFHLVADQQDALHRDLSERQIDLMIAWKSVSLVDERQSFEFLYDDRCVVVAGVENPWARRRAVKLADLVAEAWILPPADSVLGAVAMQAFRARGLDHPNASVLALPDEVRASLVATGRFLSVFPASAMNFFGDRTSLKVLPVELPLAQLPIGIVTLKNRTLSPVAQLFIEHAREVAKPLAKRKW